MGSSRVTRMWLVQSVGAIRDQGASVAAFCSTCRTIFEIELDAIIHAKGRAYSLIDQRGPCRRCDCESRAFFMYSPGERVLWRPLVTDAGRRSSALLPAALLPGWRVAASMSSRRQP